MPTILQYILIALAAIVVLCIVLKLFKVTFKTILKIAINAVIGVALIFLLNFIPGVNIPIVWWSALVAERCWIPQKRWHILHSVP